MKQKKAGFLLRDIPGVWQGVFIPHFLILLGYFMVLTGVFLMVSRVILGYCRYDFIAGAFFHPV